MICALVALALHGAAGLLDSGSQSSRSANHRVSCPLSVWIDEAMWSQIRGLEPSVTCMKGGEPRARETITPTAITTSHHKAWFRGWWTAPPTGRLLTGDVLEKCWIRIFDPEDNRRSKDVDHRFYSFNLMGECKQQQPTARPTARPAALTPHPAVRPTPAVHRRVTCPITVSLRYAEWIVNLQPRLECAGGSGIAARWHIAAAVVTNDRHVAWFHGIWTGPEGAPAPSAGDLLGRCELVTADNVHVSKGMYTIDLWRPCGFPHSAPETSPVPRA